MQPSTEDIGPVLDLARDYANGVNLLMSNNGPIRDWLNAGCGIAKDILPTMRAMMDRKRDIPCFAYFTPAILRAKDQRVATELATSQSRTVTPDQEFRQMQHLAWCRTYKPNLLHADGRAKLAGYERANGQVFPNNHPWWAGVSSA